MSEELKPSAEGAREWWIMPEQASYEQQVFAEDPSDYYPTTKGQLVRVIEKSYFDQLQADFAKYRREAAKEALAGEGEG